MAAGRAPGAHPARALGRAGPCTAPLPPPQVPHTFLLQLSGSPRSASRLSLLLPCPRSSRELLARSGDEFPLSALPARAVRGVFSPQQVRRLHNILFPQDTSFWEGNYASDLIHVCGMRSPTFGELRQPGPSGCARSSAHPQPGKLAITRGKTPRGQTRCGCGREEPEWRRAPIS